MSLTDQKLEEMAAVIENEVYPYYENGFCDFREYTLFLFGALNLEITTEELDSIESRIMNRARNNLQIDNLQDPDVLEGAFDMMTPSRSHYHRHRKGSHRADCAGPDIHQPPWHPSLARVRNRQRHEPGIGGRPLDDG